MADIIAYIKNPQESIKDFNKRMLRSCMEMPVTATELRVVPGGQPWVQLICEMKDEATDEDVEEGLATEVGEECPVSPPVNCALATVRARTREEADASEGYLEKLYTLAGEGITDVDDASGTIREWREWKHLSKYLQEQIIKQRKLAGQSVSEEDLKKTPYFVEEEVMYALVTWYAGLEDDDDDDGGEEEHDSEPPDEGEGDRVPLDQGELADHQDSGDEESARADAEAETDTEKTEKTEKTKKTKKAKKSKKSKRTHKSPQADPVQV